MNPTRLALNPLTWLLVLFAGFIILVYGLIKTLADLASPLVRCAVPDGCQREMWATVGQSEGPLIAGGAVFLVGVGGYLLTKRLRRDRSSDELNGRIGLG
jgi:hypothetical protein